MVVRNVHSSNRGIISLSYIGLPRCCGVLNDKEDAFCCGTRGYSNYAGTVVGAMTKNKKSFSLTFSGCALVAGTTGTPLKIYFSRAEITGGARQHAGGDLPAKEAGGSLIPAVVLIQPHLIQQHFVQLGVFVYVQLAHRRALMGADGLLAAV